jgi:hypothetical protein
MGMLDGRVARVTGGSKAWVLRPRVSSRRLERTISHRL